LYVVVEKILGLGESLPKDWAVHGTTGYDALNVINGLFVDRANEAAFTQLYDDFIDVHVEYDDLVYQKKLLILDIALASELQMLSAQLARLALQHRRSRDFTQSVLSEALRQVIACFPVYRSYISDESVREEDRKSVNQAIDAAKRKGPATPSAVYDCLRNMLLQNYPESATEQQRQEQLRFAGKFQQLTAPVTAKGIEDTAFYVYNRLVSLNEVGGDPGHFGISPEAAHAYFNDRQQNWADGLTPLSTHDTKRSEDVRARINVLSEIPDEWSARIRRWRELNATHRKTLDAGIAPSANDEYLLYQTLVGAFPFQGTEQTEDGTFVSRIQTYMQKAMREAKVHTRWTDPNANYESAVAEFIAQILDPQTGGPFLEDFRPFQARVSHWGMLNSLAQTLLRLGAPGVPDTYQGSELWDLSLVDPDNRRPVDYQIRRRTLRRLQEDFGSAGSRRGELAHELAADPRDARVKLFVIWQMLELRRQLPGLFSSGAYVPVDAAGSRAYHLFSFMRHSKDQSTLIAVPRLVTRLTSATASLPLGAGVWHDTRLILPITSVTARWRNVFTGQILAPIPQDAGPSLSAAELFADFPVAALISE
jgi:(1->4)-alpha-D-glucan 1-alpha-D-glucosylmutase